MIDYYEAYTVLKPLIIFIIGMVIYSLFIFKFYRFVARRDIFELNLQQYNKAEHPFLKKTFGSFLYLVEYLLVFPLFTFLWFAVMVVLIAFLAKEQTAQSVLLVSIAVVATVRVTSYYKEELSRDLAKMLPFALLGVFLVDISFFSFASSFTVVKQIPFLWKTIIYYLLFVIVLEFILRIVHSFVGLFRKKKK